MSSKEFLETSFLCFFLFEANVVRFPSISFHHSVSCKPLVFILPRDPRFSPSFSFAIARENYDLKFKQKDGISYPEMVSEKFKYICALSYIVEQNSDSIFREQAIRDFRSNDGESVGCGTVYR